MDEIIYEGLNFLWFFNAWDVRFPRQIAANVSPVKRIRDASGLGILCQEKTFFVKEQFPATENQHNELTGCWWLAHILESLLTFHNRHYDRDVRHFFLYQLSCLNYIENIF